MPTLNDFLTIEDDPDLLKFTFEFDDMLMWPFIRFYVFNNIILPRTFDWSSDWSTDETSKKNLRLSDMIRYALDTLKWNPFRSRYKPFDCLIFTGQGTVKVEDRYFNRVVDYFALTHEDRTLTVEDSFKWKYAKPRYFSNYCYHDYIHIMAYAGSKLNRVRQRDKDKIEDLLSFLKEKFNAIPLEDTDLEIIRNKLRLYSKILKSYKYYYSKLFDKFKPEVVVVEDACFGMRCSIVKWARDRQIKTVEPQHGIVSRNHPAYNYGEYVRQSSVFSAYLPHYFLSYGKYWEDLINIPAEKVTIGNPYYSENIKKTHVVTEPSGKKILLLISQPAVTSLIVRIALELATLMDPHRFELKFRPHPLEWPFIRARYPEVTNTDHITIDNESNLYKSLSKAHFVIGFNSTALFEAVDLCRAVYVIEHSGNEQDIPRSLFKRFSTSKDLLKLIESHQAEDRTDRSDIWASDWKDNYIRFMDTIL